MKKILTKIIGASLAIAMMIGVGAGLNYTKPAKLVDADAGESFELASSVADNDLITLVGIESGNYYSSAGQASNNRSAVAVTHTGNTITAVATTSIFKIEVDPNNNSYWNLLDISSGAYLYNASASKSYLRSKAYEDADNMKWTISIADGTNKATITSKSTTRPIIRFNYNSGSPLFNCYASGQLDVYVYKKVASSATVESVSASIKDGNYYVGNRLSASDFNVTANWSDETTTNPTAGFTWTVNGVPNGTLEEGNNAVVVTYESVSSPSFNVVGTIEPGTLQNNPLDVEAAIAKGTPLSNNAETEKEYYIQGTVSEVTHNSLASNSHQATFWLFNGETAHGFQAYNIGVEEGCDNYGDLLVGAEVLIKGKIKRYNSTIESGTGAKILSISYTAPVLTGVSLNKTESSLEVGNTETLVASPIPNIAELGTVTWASSNSFVATVEDGVVTAVTAGSATITAFVDDNGNGSLDNEEMYAACVFTVTAAPAEKVVIVDSISAGDTVFMFARAVSQQFNGISGSNSNTYGAGAAYTGTPNKDGIAFEVADGNADDSYAFKIKSGTNANKYIAWNAGNYLVVADSITDNSSWSVSFDSDGNATIANVADSNREIWWNVSSPRFSCYTGKSDGTGYKYTQLGKVMTPTSYFETATSIKTISGTESNGGATVENVALRFGEIIPVSAWSNINANWTITDYGIMFARGSMLTARSKSSLEEVFRNDPNDVAIVHKQVFSNPNVNGDNYVFTARLNLEEVDYDETFYAAPFIVAGGAYYFLQEMHDSVRTLAEECYNNGGSSLSQTALATLKGNN